ncbi:glutamate-5-semialdehyde dehydrogenase [Membranicola marinus]|uniref:Gamma-glutamyl phosphate reductase n=1 Tax=Membranihabitans marinus TaxID=1227546 RepID=A0A953HNG1_9BACT|nr:glutamate-5-semialdehyde dehydrogenase [Membranihabitans marinus]MBY5958837.1 glutamate-5-semialdehyde dehydrogenase [Membranihabitans marinus]
MKLLTTEKKNQVLQSMINLLDQKRDQVIAGNKKDLDAFQRDDQALYDRLIVDDKKVDDMIRSVREVKDQDDPVGVTKSERKLDTGLQIINRTAPFGTIMIIYESRPDVTIEAAVLAFKANNKILLKGGKEAIHSNQVLVDLWHQALEENGLDKDWITLFTMDRQATQEFLKNPDQKLDLIVPRGGERLIAFVKEHAECPVLVSGRGNNFLYVDADADWDKTMKVILNAKTDKISACNALDKVLINKNATDLESRYKSLLATLKENGVEVITPDSDSSENGDIWYEEFLAMKILVDFVDDMDEAIDKINEYSGGHSTAILTENSEAAHRFMEQVDSAAVYHNASTRFTDGGAMGVGAELAISTDKLHHRGPLGLEQLVTNKYYVFGDGHTRD